MKANSYLVFLNRRIKKGEMKKIKPIEPTSGIDWKLFLKRLTFTKKLIIAALYLFAMFGVLLKCHDINLF